MTPKITSHDVVVVQIPGTDNNYHAICNVRITTPSGQFSSIGEAQGANTATVQGLLQQAELDGYERALNLLHTSTHTQHQEPSVPWDEEASHITFPDNKLTNMRATSGNAGGGSKPASQKQQDVISKLCAKNNMDCKTFIQSTCGKEIHQLQGNEAHNLIQFLNNVSS
jgi:hypothetical protein